MSAYCMESHRRTTLEIPGKQIPGDPKMPAWAYVLPGFSTGILSCNSIPRSCVWRPCSSSGYSCDTRSLFLHAFSIHFTYLLQNPRNKTRRRDYCSCQEATIFPTDFISGPGSLVYLPPLTIRSSIAPVGC